MYTISISTLIIFVSLQFTSTTDTINTKEFIYEIVIPEKHFLGLIPVYQIKGFNQIFNLSLIKDEQFLSPSFLIQYFNKNQTWINRNIEHCFYKGYVNRNYFSFVSISLCNGLFGTFIYDNIQYFIEPKQDFEHVLYKQKGLAKTYFEERSYEIRKKRQLNIDSPAKHVEILVAYDDSMKEFHSEIDIKSYILTLFNYVSHLYSDESIGNNIKISVVKSIELGSDFNDYIKSTNDAMDILNEFCQWQRDYNIPGTYDAAILLTRIRLCNKRSKNCDTLGLTELGKMCSLTSNCAVVRDNGFASAFTIAHEIAHLFGIRHDNDNICLNFHNEQNLMAASLTFNYNHYKWSNCSRYYFTQYIESNRYPCLNNIPNHQPLLKQQTFPGYFSNLDDQCRRAFGIHFEYCKDLSHGPECIRLYCREIASTSALCITNHAQWSDGTLCSESGKRCFHGQCQSIDDWKVINGNWSEWSTWSSCTRTCGSAIQKSQRFCDNPKPENGGEYCSGQSIRIQSCEDNLSCEDSHNAFRRRQCSMYNNHRIDSTLPENVQFEPKYNVLPNERCKLICKVSNDHLERSFIFNDYVEDGTPCGHEDETRDLCINGICMPFGCDNKYGSNASEDICGVCSGQNHTCKLINGQKMVSNFGITNLIDIPVNTTYVSIKQISRKKDRFYLAIKYTNGTYILNGLDNLQLYSIKTRIGSAVLFYTGFESSNESIVITGRLKYSLEIQVISMYRLRLLTTNVSWEYYLAFNDEDYMVNWTVRNEGNCSARCGDGYKYIFYQCTRMNLAIDEEICRKSVGEKPETIVSCVGDCQGIGWVYGGWSECYLDEYCIRKRAVECRNESDLAIANDYCISEFIFNIDRCANVACEQSKWNFSIWSDCDCLSNRRRRDVSCIRDNQPVNEDECSYQPKPDETIACSKECHILPYWKTYSWQPCTAMCSSYEGIRYRRVACLYQDLIVQDDYCDSKLKPIEQEWCTTNMSCLIQFFGRRSSVSVD